MSLIDALLDTFFDRHLGALLRSFWCDFQDIQVPEPLPPLRVSRMIRNRLAKLLHSPLILGASNSAEIKVRGAISRVLDHLRDDLLNHGERTGRTSITRLAQHGARGRHQIASLNRETLAAHSVVIGLDLFFWDTVIPPFAESNAAIERLHAMTLRSQTPVIIGTAPRLSYRIFQPGIDEINARIRQTCQLNPLWVLIDLEAIHAEVQRRGFFALGDTQFKFADIAPDGLHMSSVACEYLAREIIQSLSRHFEHGLDSQQDAIAPSLRHSLNGSYDRSST